jgi:hypothetical protein
MDSKTFWAVLFALIVFNWLHPFNTRAPDTETAYFLQGGHKGQSSYQPSFPMQYSADRGTQTVVTQEADLWANTESNCTVLSAVTWNCANIGSNDGEVWIGVGHLWYPNIDDVPGLKNRESVSWLRYYTRWLAPVWKSMQSTPQAGKRCPNGQPPFIDAHDGQLSCDYLLGTPSH